jgi:hypothetical protein
MNSTERVANDIKKLQESLYTPKHEFRVVDAKSFRHLDIGFYDKIQDALVAKGCTCLGDVEIVEQQKNGLGVRTFIRVLVTRDGLTCVGLYHFKPKLWLRSLLWIMRVRVGRTIDCETELSNGGYLTTSNAAQAGKLNPPPGFDRQYFPLNTLHETVFHKHCERLGDFVAANPGISITPMRTLEEALAMQQRMHAAKAAHRKEIGYVTQDELERLGANPKNAAEIKQALDRSETGV